MKLISLFVALFLAGLSGAAAQTLTAARTVPANTVLTAADLVLSDARHVGALSSADQAVGLETRVTLYAGRPVLGGQVGPPAVVGKNQIVPLVFGRAALRIETEGRTLDRGAVGARVRVMNLASRAVVVGTVTEDGTVRVGR